MDWQCNFLGVHISEELRWATYTRAMMKRSEHRLDNFRRLKRFGTNTMNATNPTNIMSNMTIFIKMNTINNINNTNVMYNSPFYSCMENI